MLLRRCSQRALVSVFRSWKNASFMSSLTTTTSTTKRWFSSGENEADRRHPLPAEELISKVPPTPVKGYIAKCDGGGDGLGHPIEYIQLDTRIPNKVETCKYCGLRFVHDSSEHGH